MARERGSSPVHRRLRENRRLCRLIRVPATLATVYCPWPPCVPWDHGESFRWLVLVIAMAWGRRHVANLDRSGEATPHRTRVNTFLLGARWDPAAALRQQALARLRARPLGTGETLDVVLEDAKQATRGQAMEAVATMTAPLTAGDIRGPQEVRAWLVVREHGLPWGLRLDGTPEHAHALGPPVDQTTELAGQRIRALKAPAGGTVMGWCEASDRCHPGVKAGQEQPGLVASPLKSHRRLCMQGWTCTAGRDGTPLLRRRHTPPCVFATPQGVVCARVVEAGGLEVRTRGQRPGVCSRTGSARQILGRVTDAPALAGAGRIRTDENRWAVEPCFQDSQQRLGLGHSQKRPSRAAMTPRPLVGLADALLTHLRSERHGAPGQRPHHHAADRSVAPAQEALRCVLWDDLVADLQEQHRGEAVLAELERLRVA
jgi:hypothetical protein